MSHDADVPNECYVFVFWTPSDKMSAYSVFPKSVEDNFLENRSASPTTAMFDDKTESHRFCSFINCYESLQLYHIRPWSAGSRKFTIILCNWAHNRRASGAENIFCGSDWLKSSARETPVIFILCLSWPATLLN